MKRLRVRGFVVTPLLALDDGEHLDDVQAQPIHVKASGLQEFVDGWPERLAEAEASLNSDPPPE